MSTANPSGASSRGYDWQQYAKEYRKKHPEKVKQWNINKAVNMLRREGFTVIPPNGAGDPAKEGAVND